MRSPHIHRMAGIWLICLFSINATAQLKVIPLDHTTPSTKTQRQARTNAEPLTLPFFDDFSFTPVADHEAAGIPLATLWESGAGTWVNPGNGANAPSINVATMDGLNSEGLPYSEQSLNNGFADVLTSNPIDLSTDQIPLAERNKVFLSFFYQWGGYGEEPDSKDFLRLEFKNADGGWETAATINTLVTMSRDVFYDQVVQITEDRFFHDAFQFRFRNFGRLSGPFDSWNIDYVYLDKGRLGSIDIADAALTQELSALFGRYTAMPLDHFRETQVLAPPSTGVYNLRNSFAAINFHAEATITNYFEDETVTAETIVLNESRGIISETENTIQPFERITTTLDVLPDPLNEAQFNPAAKQIDITIEMNLIPDNNFPEELFTTSNDTINSTYHLDDYYAYDDGSAEYAAILTTKGDRAAYQFEVLRSDGQPDILAGFDIYVPRQALSPNLTIPFFILSDNDGMPGPVLYSINKTVTASGRNEFQSVSILPLPVSGKFYIGWQAPIGGTFPVGIDYANNTSDKVFVDTNGTWVPSLDIPGSLMIRPVFGEGVISGIPESTHRLQAYPNPSEGVFYLPEEIDNLEIISTTGQRIAFELSTETDGTRISIPNAQAGLYILKIQKDHSIITQKIVIR